MDQAHPELVRAIEQRLKLSIVYHGERRTVEPQAHGLGSKRLALLRVYQPGRQKTEEPLFTVSKIEQLQVLDEHFQRPGPNYRKNDSAMKVIFAQL